MRRLNKLLHVLPVFSMFVLLFNPLVWAQEGEKENRITQFEGGKIRLSFFMNSSLLYAIGSRAGSLGGSVALADGSASLFWNPAGLAFLKRPEVMFDLTPRISPDISSYIDIQEELNSALDDAIEDFRVPGSQISYPELDLSLGQKGGLNAGSLAVPFRENAIGASFYQPFSLNFQLLITGMETVVETEKEFGDSKRPIRFKSFVDANARFSATVNVFSLGLAREVKPGWSVGMAIEKYTGKTEVNAKFQIEGIMVFSGQEYLFNDPTDPRINFAAGEQNNLHQSITGLYEGSAWGGKLGTFYHVNKHLSIGGVLTLSPSLKMKGDMNLVQNTVPALSTDVLSGKGEEAEHYNDENENGQWDSGEPFEDANGNGRWDDEEELLDPTKLDIAKLTLTEPLHNPTGKSLTINMPSSIKLGIGLRAGFFSLALNYSHYMKDFSYKYRDYLQGLKLKDGFGLGLDFKYARLGAGIILADEIRKGFKDDEDSRELKTGILVPSLAFGIGFPIRDSYRIDSILLAFPSQLLRISVSYMF